MYKRIKCTSHANLVCQGEGGEDKFNESVATVSSKGVVKAKKDTVVMEMPMQAD